MFAAREQVVVRCAKHVAENTDLIRRAELRFGSELAQKAFISAAILGMGVGNL